MIRKLISRSNERKWIERFWAQSAEADRHFDQRVLTGFDWLRVGLSGGFLWTR
jgi:hypothetical protein